MNGVESQCLLALKTNIISALRPHHCGRSLLALSRSAIRHELFTNGYGFVVDYLAEVLKHLRTEDFTGSYKAHFEIMSEVSTRDQTGFEKTFSGLMKILFPDGKASALEVGELLSFSMEARRRVREHILRIDDTFAPHDFSYRSLVDGRSLTVVTPEETQYPTFAKAKGKAPDAGPQADSVSLEAPVQLTLAEVTPETIATPPSSDEAQPGHIVVPENTKGWSYRRLFAKHLKGARRIVVNDPYVRLFFQARNVMEFLQMVYEIVPEGDEVAVELVTQPDREASSRQEENLNQMMSAFDGSSVSFSWKFDSNPNFHARSITTDTGWKITTDRGLDIFQRFESGPFSLEQALQEARLTRGAEITYLRI